MFLETIAKSNKNGCGGGTRWWRQHTAAPAAIFLRLISTGDGRWTCLAAGQTSRPASCVQSMYASSAEAAACHMQEIRTIRNKACMAGKMQAAPNSAIMPISRLSRAGRCVQVRTEQGAAAQGSTGQAARAHLEEFAGCVSGCAQQAAAAGCAVVVACKRHAGADFPCVGVNI